MTATIALLACLAASHYIAGVIWFVQRVHYPLLGLVDPAGFDRYHVEHVRRTGPVVAPAMLIELASAAVLVVDRPPGSPAWLAAAGLAAAVVAWTSTAMVQVPLHRRLARGSGPETIRALVRTNRVRTAAWTAHAAACLAMVALALAG